MGAGETDGAGEGVFVSCNGLSMVFGSVPGATPSQSRSSRSSDVE